MSNRFYPYEYFCGANIVLTADGQPLLEAAGISYTEMDSMQPIYGYCSRLFDAVAPGQKIIQGSLVINQVDPDYLFESIRRGRRISGRPTPMDTGTMEGTFTDESGLPIEGPEGRRYEVTQDVYNVGDVWRNSNGVSSSDLSVSGYGNWQSDSTNSADSLTSALESKYWDRTPFEEEAAQYERGQGLRMTDPSLVGPTNIEIQFANDFAIVLYSCFFVSRSSGIQIDENVILEEHTFFARASSVKDL